MSLFKTFRGNKSNLPQDINDGAIYALQDTEELYIDISEDKRVKISDIVEVENKEALPLAPLENKFYYVKNIGSLYKYNGTEYLEISQSPLYVDFILDDMSSDEYYTFTTTFSFEKAVEEYKKGRKVIAKLSPPNENPQIWMNYCVNLIYSEDYGNFASNSFLVEELHYNEFRYGDFLWANADEPEACQLRLRSCGVTSFNGRDGDVVPKLGDYTPEMIGVEDSVLLTSKKAKIRDSGGINSGVFFANDRFFVFPRSYSGDFSTDGISWESFSMPYSSCDSIAYGGNQFAAANGSYLMTSSDCLTWTSMRLSSAGRLVVRGKDCFVIFPIGKKNTAFVLNDGSQSLKSVTLPITPNNDWRALYTGSKFIAMGDKTLISSENGVDWTVNSQELPYYFHTLVYGNGKLLGIPYGGNPSAISLDEGNSWTQGIDMPESTTWEATYGDGKFVAIGKYGSYRDDSSIIMYSEDGLNWKTADSYPEKRWETVAYGNSRFVAVDSDGEQAIYSTDGVEWLDKDTSIKLFKPDNTDITEEVKSLVAPTVMTEAEITALWNSVE